MAIYDSYGDRRQFRELLIEAVELLEAGHGGGYAEEAYEEFMEKVGKVLNP